MKKSTKKTIMAAIIILVFGLSSIGFVVSSFGTPQETTTTAKPLTSFVVDGEINAQTENAYLQGGFTFLKLYYNQTTDSAIKNFVANAPDSFQTPNGQTQIVAQRISSAVSYIKIVNINGEHNLYNLTTGDLVNALCTSLVVQPTECAIGALNLTGP